MPRRFAKKTRPSKSIGESVAVYWRVLGLLNIYRIVLATGAIVCSATPFLAQLLHLHTPYVGSYIALAYLAFALVVIPALGMRWPSLGVQAQIEPLVDVFAAAIIVQAVGLSLGIFAVLLVPPVGVAGVVAPRLRGAMFFSALAALVVLAVAFGNWFQGALPVLYYTEGGLFALAIFAISIITHSLSGALLESQTLAARRAAEVLQLDQVNRRIIRELRTGVVVIDAAGATVRANPAAHRLLGQTGLAELTRVARNGPDAVAPGMALARGEAVVTMTLPIGDSTEGARLLFVDGAEVAVEQAQELKLQALGRLTAAIAHQIRNPLGAIAQAGQLLAEGGSLPAREQGLVRIIRRQSTRLDGLVSDILSFSRPASGKVKALRLRPWLRDYLATYGDRKPDRGAHLTVTPPGDDLVVRCDSTHLEHILSNLIDNAFLHGGAGKDVELEIVAGEERVAVEVLDRGPGLPADSDHLFEPFSTTHSSGTGLGLYIARELAGANGGRLSASNREGGGARFRLELTRSAEQPA